MKFLYTKILFSLFIIIILIASIIIYVSKINNEKQNTNQANSKEIYLDEINLGIYNFDTMNPIETNNREIIYINKLIFDSLFTLDKNYKIEPCLANEIAQIDDITYIIKINTNIKWSNGENLTVEDVIYSIEQIKKSNSIYKENVEKINEIEKIDNSTIKIKLYNQTNFFEYNLIFPIINKNNYSQYSIDLKQRLIGTGMLKIVNINEQEIILEKNDYMNEKSGNQMIAKKTYIKMYNTAEELYDDFKLGNIDFINTTNDNYEEYIGKIGYYTKEYKGRNVDFLALNCEDKILEDKLVRQAIMCCINKEELIQYVCSNSYKSNYILDFDNFLWNNQLGNYEQNYEQAKKVLEQAGWTFNNLYWNKNGRYLSLTITVNSSNEKRCKIAELLKNQLQNIGINVIIKQVSDSQYEKCLYNKDYQIILTGVSNGYSPDISIFYGENNIANYYNETIISLLSEIINITDANILIEKYKQIAETTIADAPYIFLYRNKNTILINKNSGGQIEPNNYNIYYNYWSWNRK